mgnify:CR=1 FL=1
MHLEVHVADISFSFSHASNLTFLPEKKISILRRKRLGGRHNHVTTVSKTKKTRKLDFTVTRMLKVFT